MSSFGEDRQSKWIKEWEGWYERYDVDAGTASPA